MRHALLFLSVAVSTASLFATCPEARAQTPDGTTLAVLHEAFRNAPLTRVKTQHGVVTLAGPALVEAGIGWDTLKEPSGVVLRNPIEWSEIEQVEVMQYRRRGLLGAAIGAGLGAATGALIGINDSSEVGGLALLYGAVFAVPGGLLGYLFPAKHWAVTFQR